MIYNDKNSFIKHRDISVSNYHYKARTQEHSHTFFELAYIVSGEGVHIVDGSAVPVRRGCYFLLDKNASHCYDGNIEVLNLTFNPSFLDKTYCDIVTVSELYDKITNKTDYTLPVSDWNCHTYYDEGLLEKRIRYIQDEIEQMEFGYSASYISECFKEFTGYTFSQYLKMVRMKAAHQIIQDNPEMSVETIVASVGYADIKYFSSVFKATIGITPGKDMQEMKKIKY